MCASPLLLFGINNKLIKEGRLTHFWVDILLSKEEYLS